MRKIAPVAFLTAGFLVFGGLLATPAFADDEEDSEDKTSLVSPKPKPVKIEDREDHDDDEEVDEDAKHQELREKYGESGKLMLPPLVIRPKHAVPKPTPSIASSPGAVSTGSVGAGESAEDEAKESNSVGNASLGGFIAVNPSKGGAEFANDVTGKSVNPVQNAPIEISTVNSEQKTPVAVFIDAAKVGLGVMLVGVLALGLVAGYRAIRHK
jgi:hypothetical protein